MQHTGVDVQNSTSETINGQNMTIDIDNSHTSGPLAGAFIRQEHPYGAFLGVSLKNKMSNRKALAQIIPWLSRRATAGVVVIGDYLHRHNLVALRGLSPKEALEKAITDGKRPLRYANEIVSRLGNINSLQVCSAADLIETSECREVRTTLSSYFSMGGSFFKDVNDVLTSYLSRVCDEQSTSIKMDVREVLKEYMLEEIAMFLYLYQIGYPVEVYPGPDLSIMRKIGQGTYVDFPINCPLRSHVSISLT